jgi:hypothetical protein
MMKASRRPRLVLESAPKAGVVAGVWVQELERHPRLERLALGLVNNPHPARADQPDDPVVAETLDHAELGEC